MATAFKHTRQLSSAELDVIQEVLNVVDERGKEMDRKWGIGRLPALVPIDWAERFATQKHKFGSAVLAWEVHPIRTHGEAMLRAYAKLDELAEAAGHRPGPPEQWEFETPDGLVILVQDIKRANQVETHGRRCQIWSLDEIASVIRAHPEIVAAKREFPGAELVSIRVARDVRRQLDDSLEGLPI